MSNYTQEILDKKYDEAPELLRKIMYADETIAVIRRIGSAHQLHIDQVGGLVDEIDYVILGLEPSIKFTANIQERLGISAAEAEQIAMEVNKEIFMKIRESLKQLEERQNTPAPEDLLREMNSPTTVTGKTSEPSLNVMERKLSEPVNLKPVEEGIMGTPDTPAELERPAHVDPYRERLE